MSTITAGGIRSTARRQPEDEGESLFSRYSQIVATATTGALLLAGLVLGATGIISRQVETVLYALAYLTGGTRATIEALRSLRARTVNVDLLMVLAAGGAAVIGHWLEGGILLFLFSLGNTLEHYAMGRTYQAIRALMELSPEDALVERDGVERRLHVSELRLDDVVIVKPGERIAVDGVIERGESAIDQSAITGESMPVSKQAGDTVFAGTINGHGALRVRVTRLAHESTLAKIIAIVQEAQAQKSATQRFTDRFEGWYAGGVIAAAALYAVLPIVLVGKPAADSLYHAMILLVVASPCALVISTPASTLSALANAARNGILFKGAVHLENMGVVSVVAFDKTGTLTVGRPRLTDIHPLSGMHEDDLLTLVAAVERHSEHPLAQAVLEVAAQRGLEAPDVESMAARVGHGLEARVDGATVLVGNEKLFVAHGWEPDPAAQEIAASLRDDGKTTMYVGVVAPGQPRMLGVLGVADTVRPTARQVIEELRALGVRKTIILTGDNERAARAIARQSGVSDVRSGLLPEEKLTAIEQLKREYGSVAMVGDGVNDAPALAAATIGVAMGAAGADVALETADVVLMSDDLTKLPYAIALSRKARRVIRQNLAFALTVITVLVIGTLFGVTTLPLGVVGHEGSTIVVVMNGLRLLRGVPTWRAASSPARAAARALAG